MLLEAPARRSNFHNGPVGNRVGPGKASHPRQARSAIGSTRRSIALVEDEKELLTAYSSVFKRLGWSKVFSAEKGEDIVHAVRNRQVEPDIVIMDYRLPGMDGIEAAKKIVRRMPDTKVVITTADDSVRAAAEEAGLLFLQKPFTIASLVRFLEVL